MSVPHAVPDWVHPGAQVAMYGHGTGFGDPVSLTTVERLTATQIVLANGRRYRRDNLRRQLGTAGYRSAHLMPATAPEVRRALARAAVDRLRDAVDDLLKRIPRNAEHPDELLAALGKAAELVEATRARVVKLKGADS